MPNHEVNPVVDVTDKTCFHNIFHPTLLRCLSPAVGPKSKKVGNATDKWVWCEAHGGVPSPEETKHDN